jgi:signal peptidase I
LKTLLQIIKVAGNSLAPAYQDGDFVLVSGVPLLVHGIQPGDTVVFRHPRLGRLIKLVERLEDGGRSVFVIGLDPDSSDSRTFGTIPRGQVQGKVIWHFAPESKK